MSVTIQVKALSFSYSSTQVLSGVNFQVGAGDFIGVVGPNGSGKSTLLKNLTSYLTPEQGAVYLDNKELMDYNIRALSRKQGVVSQENHVNFNFTVYELVSMGRAPYMNRFSRMTAADREIVKLSMEDTNCWYLRDRQLFQLSGGEKQRVILARALAQTPELLLLDEPTTFLDLGYQKELMDLLARLNRERNLTVIMVLHDLNLAAEYCQELILMKEGQIVDIGTPDQVLVESSLEKVYRTKLTVTDNPVTHSPMVALGTGVESNDDKKMESPLSGIFVHVISGGGVGEQLLTDLYLWDCQVNLGVVNLGDSDHKKAIDLGFNSVVCEPFAPIDEQSYQRAKEKIPEVSAVILGPVPFGHGNLKNLDLIKYALELGKPVAYYKLRPDNPSDYTEGKATRILLEMASNKSQLAIIDNSSQLYQWLKLL